MSSDWNTWFWVLTALAGGVTALSPDHWLPLSLVSWKQEWDPRTTAIKTVRLLSFHVLFGAAVYGVGRSAWSRIPSDQLFLTSLLLVTGAAVLRSFRFQKIFEILRLGKGSRYGESISRSLLGPCETLLPVMIKANHLHLSEIGVLAVFWLGALLFGVIAVRTSHSLWDRPQALPIEVAWAQRRLTAIPVMLSAVIAASAVLRLI
jgi:hypothetical protein